MSVRALGPSVGGHRDAVATVQIECRCGHTAQSEEREGRITCDCGRTFAFTITEIGSARDDACDGTD